MDNHGVTMPTLLLCMDSMQFNNKIELNNRLTNMVGRDVSALAHKGLPEAYTRTHIHTLAPNQAYRFIYTR